MKKQSNVSAFNLGFEYDRTWVEAKKQFRSKAKIEKIAQVMSVK
jgi:hypothetical protein